LRSFTIICRSKPISWIFSQKNLPGTSRDRCVRLLAVEEVVDGGMIDVGHRLVFTNLCIFLRKNSAAAVFLGAP
jgi:hypothetical protein